MKIKNLKHTDIKDIVTCLSDSFSDYAIKVPDAPDFWARRWKFARVDYALSFGVFDEGKLVAFIINGIDKHDGQLTAFNTGTGVIKSHRGNQLVDKMYKYALPFFKEKGIEKYLLEVLCKNERAIRVYQRIGFKIKRTLKCFKGALQAADKDFKIVRTAISSIENPNNHFYSWDNKDATILAGGDAYESYLVQSPSGKNIGHFSLVPKNGYLAQHEASEENFPTLLAAIASKIQDVKVNNVDSERVYMIEHLLNAGLENSIDQYEMEMVLLS